ncbi:hypothetical protein LRS03_21470 [Rhizobacter sp. J219]|uniref:hypothetical protein n=1 Tax=Rhizobacter sp. J219 TaxID=2898430 RepID=UPI002151C603|nr:hypothetical protein [Rhizobacter sp. J219]MCR5885285.1 hypothetical protein [Rhizobacter sp. J219]
MSAPPRPAPAPSPPPVEAPAPPKVVVVQAPAQPEPADLAARRLIAYHEQIRQLSPQDLANEINRLNAAVSATPTAAPPDVVLELALALSQQHNGGDVARAVALLEPITKSSAPELAPWQPLARLLLGRVLEQRRLEDALNREATRNRELQRTMQQLNEKLEALKAIERSMANRPTGVPTAPATPPATPTPPASPPPAAPKAP